MTSFTLAAHISGSDERTQLNSIIALLNTTQKGTSKNADAAAGTMWIDTTGGATAWLLKVFDGTDDITVGTINTTANTFVPSGQLATFASAIVNKTGTFTMDQTNYSKLITLDATSASFIANIPASSGLTAPWYCILWKKDSSANTITVTPNSGASELLNGLTSIVISKQYTGMLLIMNGSTFYSLPFGLNAAQLAGAQTFSGAQKNSSSALTSSSGSIAVDFSLNNDFTHSFTENTTLANPSNLAVGQKGCIFLTQNAGTAYTLAFASKWKFPFGVVPSVSSTLSAIDTIFYNVRSTSIIEANLVKAWG